MITWEDFKKVDMRAGTVVSAEDFPEARNPAYKLAIDFGELGIKKTSAQITKLYKKKDLLDKQVIAVVNFPPKQIANFISEVLVLGVVGKENEVVLLEPDKTTENGLRIA
jgi:tRNA-binding protein